MTQVLNSQEDRLVVNSMESNDVGRQISNKLAPCFEGYTYNTTLPGPEKMESGKSLHSNQQLMMAKDRIVDDSNSNGESSNGNMELDFLPNEGEDFPDQKKLSLRSWKHILWSSNSKAATEVSPKPSNQSPNLKVLSSKRHFENHDTNHSTELHSHQKKQAIDPLDTHYFFPLTRVGTQSPPLFNENS